MPKNGHLRRNQNWHGICIIYRHQDIYEQHELKDKEKSLKRKKGKVNMKKKAISLLLVGAMGGENMEFDDMDNSATTDLR